MENVAAAVVFETSAAQEVVRECTHSAFSWDSYFSGLLPLGVDLTPSS